MMWLVEKARDTPSLMQTALANPEWFLFRCASISTTAFVFSRWVVIELINSIDEVRRRQDEAREKEVSRRVSRFRRKP